ncbi:uncharacterized protein [Montipora foliosa]|uniref:uncharacterized protein n=1 Tax=Montipora foliosa TaxID=591990 RepID=UPI0035F1DFE8
MSDNGSQLVGAERELREMIQGWNHKELKEFSAEKGMRWQFTTPGAPHQNGCAEALVKGAKKALKKAIGEQILMPFELYTCLLEVANLMNQRPIGRVPNDLDDGSYLCPNEMLLGRATSMVPKDRSERPGTHSIESNSFVSVVGAELWWDGPAWLSEPVKWPDDIMPGPSPESMAERKLQREVFAVGVETRDDFDLVLWKFELRKAVRIGAWVMRFLHNSQYSSSKTKGPLTTVEVEKCQMFLVKRAQLEGISHAKFDQDQEQLNLQPSEEGVLECRGRIQGEYPMYLPDSALLAAKIVQRAHVTTLHGGVGLTMARVREKFWIPRLRKLMKRIVRNCSGCKCFQAVAFANPPPASLPRERTEGNTPFNVIGVDFAGPVKYRDKRNEEQKAHVVLYSCSLTRGVFLELLPSLETTQFIKSLKRLIDRRGRPSKVYSDNGQTFVAAAKWLKKVQKDETFHSFLSDQSIIWQFNLSRAPWWGGQFERLIGLMNSAFYKTVGQGQLSWEELGEVILDVEVTLNNHPLCYQEEDVQLPTLTPSTLLFLNTNILPELPPHQLDDKDLRKRAKFLLRTKDALWRRWTAEYLRALCERHRLKHGDKKGTPAVVIHSAERNRNCWPLGIVEQLITGRDCIVRGARLRAGRSHLERPIQHLFPLELSCDKENVQRDTTPLNPTASVFRPRRDAAVAARLRMQEVAEEEELD